MMLKLKSLASFARKYEFVTTLLMFCDVLPPLASLSRTLQHQDLDYSLVKPLISGTIATLENLRNNPGEHCSSLETLLLNELVDFNITMPTSVQQEIRRNTYDEYISTVIRHLQRHFLGVHLLEAFSTFDGKSMPEDPTMLQAFGREK